MQILDPIIGRNKLPKHNDLELVPGKLYVFSGYTQNVYGHFTQGMTEEELEAIKSQFERYGAIIMPKEQSPVVITKTDMPWMLIDHCNYSKDDEPKNLMIKLLTDKGYAIVQVGGLVIHEVNGFTDT